MNRQQYYKAFLGFGKRNVRQRVVVSPIIYPSQVEKIIGRKEETSRSILGYLSADFGALTYIKTPQTQGAVNDLIFLLKGTRCREIVFLGAIGGLARGLKIGDLVVSGRAKDVKSVASLHEETRTNLGRWRKQGYLGIDFESQVFFMAARRAGIKASAIFIVTDLPLIKPFYKKKTGSEEARIKKAVEQCVLRLFAPLGRSALYH